MPENVGVLEIKIEKSSDDSAFSLEKLRERISELKTETKGGIRGLVTSAKHLNAFQEAVENIKFDKLEQLRDILNSLNGLKKMDIKVNTKGLDKLNSDIAKKVENPVDVSGGLNDKTSVDLGEMAEVEKIKEVTKEQDKLTKSISSVGKASHKSSGMFGKFVKAIGRIAFYRAIRSVIKDITKALGEGKDNLYQWSKLQKDAEGNAFAKSLDKIASSGQYLKNSIAAMIEPLVNTFAPKLELIINKVVDVINEVNKAIAVLSGQSTWKKAKYMTIEYAKAEDKAADSAKELKKSLLGIDELNVLDNNASKATANSDIKKYEDMFETVNIDKGTQEFQKYFDDLLAGISISGAALLVIGSVIALTGVNIPLGIGIMAAGAATMFTAAVMNLSSLETTIGKVLGGIVTALGVGALAVGAILALTGVNIPLGIGLMVGGAGALGAAADVDWDSLGNKLKEAWGKIVDFAKTIPNRINVFIHNIKADIGNGIIGIINLIASPFTKGEKLIPDDVGYARFDYGKDFDEQLKANKDFTLNDYIDEKVTTFTIIATFALDKAKSTAIDFITNTWNKLSDKAKEFKATLNEKASTAKTFIIDKWNKLSDKTKSFAATLDEKKSTAKTFITDKWNKLANKTKTFTAKATDKDGKLASLKKTIDSIFDKDKKTISITATLKDSFTQTLYGIVYKLFESINNLISAINSRFKTSISLIKNPVKKVPGDSKNSTKFAWQGFASGGHPKTSEVFYARENGIPEMVGRIGNQPTVATNADIVASVSKGVASAVSSVMNGANGNVNVNNVYLDGEKIYQNVVTHNKQNTIRTGKNALAMA